MYNTSVRFPSSRKKFAPKKFPLSLSLFHSFTLASKARNFARPLERNHRAALISLYTLVAAALHTSARCCGTSIVNDRVSAHAYVQPLIYTCLRVYSLLRGAQRERASYYRCRVRGRDGVIRGFPSDRIALRAQASLIPAFSRARTHYASGAMYARASEAFTSEL